ncbi:unnamed protein product, partial [Prunus brigantina]
WLIQDVRRVTPPQRAHLMILWWKPQCNRTESWLPTPCSRLLVLCSHLQLLELQNSRHMTSGPPQPCSRQRRLLELLCLAVLPSEHSSSHTTQLPDLLHSPMATPTLSQSWSRSILSLLCDHT